MRFDIITLFPELFTPFLTLGVTRRAYDSGQIKVHFWNPRDYSQGQYKRVDDRPFGGGPGMVMTIEPLRKAISAAKDWIQGDPLVVYLSPQGKVLQQTAVNQFATGQSIILIAGRYEGIDERLIELEVDQEWSIGDYVLSGGELPAMVFMDALIRQLPGALGHKESANQDSFADGILDCPHFTRPEKYEGLDVPEVLLSGNHEKIRQWRLKQSLLRTKQRRPDLLEKLELNDEQKALLKE